MAREHSKATLILYALPATQSYWMKYISMFEESSTLFYSRVVIYSTHRFGNAVLLVNVKYWLKLNDLIKMRLKDYLASGWSLERERDWSKVEKGAGCYTSIHSETEDPVRQRSTEKLDLVWDAVVSASHDTPTDRPQIWPHAYCARIRQE